MLYYSRNKGPKNCKPSTQILNKEAAKNFPKNALQMQKPRDGPLNGRVLVSGSLNKNSIIL